MTRSIHQQPSTLHHRRLLDKLIAKSSSSMRAAVKVAFCSSRQTRRRQALVGHVLQQQQQQGQRHCSLSVAPVDVTSQPPPASWPLVRVTLLLATSRRQIINALLQCQRAAGLRGNSPRVALCRAAFNGRNSSSFRLR